MKLDSCGADREAKIYLLKASNPGGPCKALWAQDYWADNSIPADSEDGRGGQSTSAATANSDDLTNCNTRSNGTLGPKSSSGKRYATNTLGLGVSLDWGNLGAPFAIYGELR